MLNRTSSADTVIYSDHGVQFTSEGIYSKIKVTGLLPLLGTIGDADDNGHDGIILVKKCRQNSSTASGGIIGLN